MRSSVSDGGRSTARGAPPPWEHAFYLEYTNVKPDCVKAWWNVVNWADAATRFEQARA